MPRHGCEWDMANNITGTSELSRILSCGPTRVVCGAKPIHYQWSDYCGEAMCIQCGVPYQLQGGSDEQRKEDAYPYMKLKEEILPIVRKYWNETHRFTCFGMVFGYRPGIKEFNNWLEKHRPEMCKREEI